MEYKVNLSKTSRTITKIGIGSMALCLFAMWYFLDPTRNFIGGWAGAIFFTILIICVTYYAILMWPRRITVYADRLVLKRAIGSKVLLFDDIECIERRNDTAFGMKLCGSDGMFGYTGWFTNSDFGRYMSYVGDYKDTFLIVTRKRKYVMSCDRPDELVAEVKRRIEARHEA